MKTINNFLFFSLIAGFFMLSCEKKEHKTQSDLEKLRSANNTVVIMDSSQAINTITMQKIQDVLDLSTLYISGNRNTEIDTAIYSQMEKYFQKPDSLTFKNLFKELESLKVKKAMVNTINVYQEVEDGDTLDLAKFNVEYFDDKKKSIGIFEKNAQYTLVSNQANKEFKFYFTRFYSVPKKDTTSVGVTK